MANITVKGAAAGPSQVANIKLCCQIGKQMGLNKAQLAGAIATMMQESGCVNTMGGDRDSVGLYQQRPSCGWGTVAQCHTPSYAIKKFLTPYKAALNKGMGVIAASNVVQRSAFPSAPAQWLTESRKDVDIIFNGKDFGDATAKGTGGATGPTTKTTTRVKPYEFSRGNAGQPENSWDCMGRLATEVAWDRFMRAGTLWFASEDWLRHQPPRFAFAEGARGVMAVSFDADSRRNASEMKVTAMANRWSVLPGDVVTVTGQGQGDGLWLVSATHRTLWNPTTDITLKRPAPKKDEPSNETETNTVTIAGHPATVKNGAKGATSGPRTAGALYAACQEMSMMNIPYSIAHRTLVQRPPDADCSSSCCWALLKAGFPLPGGIGWGKWAPVSGNFSGWGAPGQGREFTVMYTGEHIWLRFYHMPVIRFDTSPWGSGGYGPHVRHTMRNDGAFQHRHWPGQ